MSVVIDIGELYKHFGHVRALDGLNLQVNEAEIHGFLGPNGAGKTTTIRVLLGVLRATSGTATLFGRDPWRDAVALHREIAYVPGDVTLWPSLTGGETIDLLARMRGGLDEKRRTELIEHFDLDPKKKARTYSKGNRQKVSLISAFSSRSRLLLLDEPSSGLDPLMEQVFRDCAPRGPRPWCHRIRVQPHPLRGGSVVRARDNHPGRPRRWKAARWNRCGTSAARRSGRIAWRSRRSQPHQGSRRPQHRGQHAARPG